MISELEETDLYSNVLGTKRVRCSHSFIATDSDSGRMAFPMKPYSIAWSSFSTNKIYIYDSELGVASEGVDGTKLPGFGVNLLYHIPKTNYLVCSTTVNNYSKFEVLDASKNLKRAYTFEKEPGTIFDLRYNEKTNMVALLSNRDKVAYHLFDITDMELAKKAKWPAAHKSNMASQDFDSEGKKIATLDEAGVCLISDVNSDSPLYCLKVGQSGNYNKCRWNPISPLLALSFDETRFNLVDTEKQQIMHIHHLKLHNDYRIYQIDWNKNGNILASCSADRSVNIYDIRTPKNSVRSFISQQPSIVVSVRWSSCGSMLAVGGCEIPAMVLDFGTGKTFYQSKNRDGISSNSLNFLE